MVKRRTHAHLHTGYDDHLEPLKPLDLSKVKSFYDLTSAMKDTAFGGRILGEAVDVLVEMSKDKDTFVILTLSGAMTVAKMGLLVCEMIDKGVVNAVVSTGALMAHGLVEASGLTHFKVPKDFDDKKLYSLGYNRVYDTIEPEVNLDNIEENVIYKVLNQVPEDKILSSHFLNGEIGKFLIKNSKGKGVLKSAYKMGVPVYVPAFTDSELGLDMGLYNRLRRKQGRKVLSFNPFLDLEHFTEILGRQKKLGIFTIGGGVPRNWTQQVAPYLDLILEKGLKTSNLNFDIKFSYGVKICPEPVEWGGLSGCTYEEGKSWGKFEPDAKTAEVKADATMVWPLILKAALERLGKKPLKKNIFAGKKAVLEIDKLVEENYISH